MPIFLFPLFLLSSLIVITSSTSMLTALDLCCMLYLSQRTVTYSSCHFYQTVSLHLVVWFCHFQQPKSSSLSFIIFPSTIFVSLPSIMLSGVKIGLWMSSMMWVSGLFLALLQHLTVHLPIRSSVNLFLPMTCKVLVWSPQSTFWNAFRTTVLLASKISRWCFPLLNTHVIVNLW